MKFIIIDFSLTEKITQSHSRKLKCVHYIIHEQEVVMRKMHVILTLILHYEHLCRTHHLRRTESGIGYDFDRHNRTIKVYEIKRDVFKIFEMINK